MNQSRSIIVGKKKNQEALSVPARELSHQKFFAYKRTISTNNYQTLLHFIKSQNKIAETKTSTQTTPISK